MNVLGGLYRKLLARWHYIVGLSYRHFGNQYSLRAEHEKAVDALGRAIVLDPGFARAYLERGILLWRELDHPRKAILDLTTAHTLDASLTEALFNRGIAHQQLRDYDAAIADFEAYLDVGDHPYWREYATSMIGELKEWTVETD